MVISMRLCIISIISIVLLSACGGGGASTAHNQTLTVSGTVVDSNGVRIPDATVIVMSDTITTHTDENGMFSLEVPPGSHHLSVEKDGFTFIDMAFSLEPGSTMNFGTLEPTTSYQYNGGTGQETDTISPVVTPPANITINAVISDGIPATDETISAFLSGATAMDNVDGAITAISHDAPAFIPLGITEVTFSATDAAGNTGASMATITIVALNFEDSNLGNCIRATATSNSLVYAHELRSINCAQGTIGSLIGLEQLTNLTDLDLSGNSISEINALAGLAQLSNLNLSNNDIINISQLSALTNLSQVNLENNLGISCDDLTALIATLGSSVVTPSIATNGETCTAPYGITETKLSGNTDVIHPFAQFKFNAQGDGIAAWIIDGGANKYVVASYYSSSLQEWSTEQTIAVDRTDSSEGISAPVLEPYKNGFMVAWEQTRSLYTRFFNGNSWEAPVLHHVSGNGQHHDIQLESNNENIALAWYWDNGIRVRIYSQDTWGSEQILNIPGSRVTAPLLKANGQTFMVAWTEWVDGINTANAHFASVYNGSWSSPFRTDNGTGTVISQELAAFGDYYGLLWRQKNGSIDQLFFRHFKQGQWTDSELVYTGPGSPGMYRLISNSTGFSVCWLANESGVTRLYTSIHNGTEWSDTEHELDNSPTGISTFIVESNNDSYAISWAISKVGVYYSYAFDYFISVYTASNWTTPLLVNENGGDIAVSDVNLIPSDEGFLLAWSQVIDPSQTGLYAKIYGSAGWNSTRLITSADFSETGSRILYHRGFKANPYGIMWKKTPDNRSMSMYRNNQWSAPFSTIKGDYTGDVTKSISVTNKQNDTLVAWTQANYSTESKNFTGQLYAKIQRNGVWGETKLLATSLYINTATRYDLFNVLALENGFAVTWVDDTGNSYAVDYTGTDWGTPITLDTGQGLPAMIAAHGQGFLVAWDRAVTDGVEIRTRFFDNLAGWGNMAVAAILAPGAVKTIDAISSGNNIMLVWDQQGPGYYDWQVYSAFWDGTWSVPESLDIATGDALAKGLTPKITTNNSEYAVAWKDDFGLYAREWRNGSWDDTLYIGPFYGYDLDLIPYNQGYLAVWDSRTTIYKSQYSDPSWSQPEIIGPGLLTNTDSNGTSYGVAWYDPASTSVNACIYPSQSCKNVTTNSSPMDSKLSLSKDGYILMWRSSTPTHSIGLLPYSSGAWKPYHTIEQPVSAYFLDNYSNSDKTGFVVIRDDPQNTSARTLWDYSIQ